MTEIRRRDSFSQSNQIKVALADDHEIVLRGLRMTIEGERDMKLLWEARNGRQAVEQVHVVQPDVLLLDLQMPEMDGVQAAQIIHEAHPQVTILVLTSFRDDAKLYAALRSGVNGYLLKDMDGDELVEAIRGAAHGEPQLHPDIAQRLMERLPMPADPFEQLTVRERDVLILIAQGLSNKEIGQSLSLSEVTIKGYVSAILNKLQVLDRTQAALFAVRYGLVSHQDLPGMI